MRKWFQAAWRLLTSPSRWARKVNESIKDFFTEEPEDTPLGDSFQKAIDQPEELFVHLDALRKHIFRALAALGLTTVFSFTFARNIIDILARPVGGIEGLVAIDPTEPIGVFMRVSLLSGFSLAFPIIALELYLFVAPGLKKRSRTLGLIAIPIATLFFLGGMAFAYYIMMPVAIPFLITFMGMEAQMRPSTYVRFITNLLFWVGAIFEFPLIIYVLARMGIVQSTHLVKQWRIAVVIIAILAAIITPTVDPVTMSVVMAPMIALYFFSIVLARIAQRSRN
ncbi:MAG: twin-arginine translocase subunit TatC [Anaerolineales bacterium]|nr:twin-arginine translocase subunit TatC [Anaerolineales bacterium]